MYSVSIDGQDHEASHPRKIPPSSSLLWARNLRHYIRSGSGLGSKALMVISKWDFFICCYWRLVYGILCMNYMADKPEEGSISHRVQRVAKYRFLKKQSDLLLNADDLDAMWVCFKENCVIDDATGAEKARIDMSELDEDSDGFLQPHEMEAYIRGLIPNLAQLWDMPATFIQTYCRIAAHKFFFFCDSHRREKGCIKKILLSNCLQELMELHQESEEEVTDIEQAENWFSLTSAQRICAYSNQFSSADMFLALDKDMNGTLSKQELREYYFVHTQKCPSPVHQLWFNLERSLPVTIIHLMSMSVMAKLEEMCAVSGPMTIERIFSKKRENRKKNDRRTEFTVRHVFAVSREFAVSYRSRQPPLVQTYSSDKNNSTAVPADMRWIKTIKTIDYLSKQADEDTIPMTACTILWSHRSF
ncbi:hypothetical protein TEA_018372 [Camellia sinensis var. sinensis]|uniref:EF-hand domain-containing protein n=1 Tax=Camellia sinensis var. sinensis TaxID=542762 RepID=A0A4S4D598_CAMSN|nr:hypothetical protein TEA_018372 [Camellia sinensis var. sinensis]